jgi:hypothetical protein
VKYLGAVLILGLCGTGFGQVRGPYGSLGGFGNVVYPGTGHAPYTPPGGITGPYFFGRPGGGGRSGFGTPFGANHPQHQRTTIVPYPLFYGGYGYLGGYGNGYDPSGGDPSANGDQAPPVINSGAAPSVVINQNYVPQPVNPQVREYNSDTADQQSGLRLYQNPSHPYADAGGNVATRPQAPADDEPTIYLIAFKDHSVVQALGYWMEGSTLHYVSVEHSLNQASIDLIDRDLSQRLNNERGLDFRLPAAAK